MAFSFIQYVGDGATTLFAIPFPYINQTDVTVKVNGVVTAITYPDATHVSVTPAPAVSAIVEVRRTTAKSTANVVFQDGSTLGKNDLNADTNQLLYIAQEAFDATSNSPQLNALNQYDALNHNMINVADPLSPQDAVTKNYVDAKLVAAGNVTPPGASTGTPGFFLKALTASTWGWVRAVAADISDATAFGISWIKAANASAANALIASGSLIIDDPANAGNLTVKSPVNAQTGTAYTIVAADRGKLVTNNNAAAVANTLPQATGNFGAGFYYYTKNLGAGFVTITPAISTIDGNASLILAKNQSAIIWSDGVNYQVEITSGKNAQTVNFETGAVATGTTTYSFNDTIPQNTAGDQYMSLAITPTNVNSTLIVDVVWVGSISIGGSLMVALFQDATANALSAVSQANAGIGALQSVSFRHKMAAGTTAQTTFKVRAGPNTAGTTTFNGQTGGRLFGGVIPSSITITELLP